MVLPNTWAVFKPLLVFINNERSLLLFSKGVHWEAKKLLKIYALSTVFVIVSPDMRIWGTEENLMLFKKLFKTIQSIFGSVRSLLFLSIASLSIPYKVGTLSRYSAKFSKNCWILVFPIILFCYLWSGF